MIVDCHQHVGSIGQLFLRSAVGPPSDGPDYYDWDANRRAEAMADIGISQTVVMPSFEYETTDGPRSIGRINEHMATYLADNAFVVAGLGIVDPFSMSPDEAVAEIAAFSRAGLKGVAWHTRLQRVPTNAPWVREVVARSRDSVDVHYFHCVSESELEAPWRLIDLARSFPDVTFVAVSSLSGFSQCEEMIFLCSLVDNVLVDTGAMLTVGGWVQRFVEEVGAHRILFGSDLYVDPEVVVNQAVRFSVDSAQISSEDRDRIYSGNCLQLFDVPYPVDDDVPG